MITGVLLRADSVLCLVAQLYPTLCDPMDYSLPGFSVHGTFQARILEWMPFSFPGDLPDLGIEPTSPVLQSDSLPSEPSGKPLLSSTDSFVGKGKRQKTNKPDDLPSPYLN